MKQVGGKGRMPLWLLALRNPVGRQPDGSFELDAGCMLSVTWGSAVLFSIGIKGVGTIGIGWVTKRQRQLDAYHAASEHLPEPAYDTFVAHDHHAPPEWDDVTAL